MSTPNENFDDSKKQKLRTIEVTAEAVLETDGGKSHGSKQSKKKKKKVKKGAKDILLSVRPVEDGNDSWDSNRGNAMHVDLSNYAPSAQRVTTNAHNASALSRPQIVNYQ